MKAGQVRFRALCTLISGSSQASSVAGVGGRAGVVSGDGQRREDFADRYLVMSWAHGLNETSRMQQ